METDPALRNAVMEGRKKQEYDDFMGSLNPTQKAHFLLPSHKAAIFMQAHEDHAALTGGKPRYGLLGPTPEYKPTLKERISNKITGFMNKWE